MHPREVNSIFSRPTLRSLGKGVVPTRVQKLVHEQIGLHLNGDETLSHLFDAAYKFLIKRYRSEYVYKNEIVSRIVFGRHSPKTTSFQTEFRAGTSIADAVVFNGTSTVYEIKTELDGLHRLTGQLRDYLSVFDKIYVVTHDAGLDAALSVVPNEVGVLHLTRRGSLSEVKACITNADNTSPVAIFNTLRRAEYLPILKDLTGWQADVPPGHLYAAARERFSELTPHAAHAAALSAWRTRTVSGRLPDFVCQLPASLRALGLSEPLSSIARERVLACLQLPISRV